MNKIILAVLMSVCICGMAFGGSLVARYEFEGSVNDSAGTHHGTIHGNTSLVMDAQRGNVAYFDGSGDYISIPDSPDFTTSTITVTAWVKGAGGDRHRIFSHYDHGNNQRSWTFGSSTPYYPGSTPKVLAGLSSDGGWVGHDRKEYISTITAFDDTWRHVAFTFDGPSSTLKLYIDGIMDVDVLKINDDAFSTLHDSTASLSIGCDFNTGIADYFFKGYIDDVRFYNHVLSDAEVMAIVPEPMTLILVGAGALMLRKKRLIF